MTNRCKGMTHREFDELVCKKDLDKEEREALEPYKVKRAVIMAAGLGSRLRPLTLKRPKPLITVNGKRIIDTIIDALYAHEINEIYVIRGYLGEQFDELHEKYPDLKMLNNYSYSEGNNILSAHLAGNLLAGAYVMPADIYIRDPSVFSKYQYTSNVLGYSVDRTEDWCIETDADGRIIRLSPGGEAVYKDTGIFYWDAVQGEQLAKDIMKVCSNKEGWSRYWSNVPFEIYKDHFRSYIRECSDGDVVEIDTIEDLRKMDASY